MYILYIFLPICGLSIHCLKSIFRRADCFLNFNKICIFTFIFHGSCFLHWAINLSPNSQSDRFSPKFLSGFIFLHLTYRFIIHIASFFVWKLECLKRLSSFHLIAFIPFQRFIDCVYVGRFLGAFFCFHSSMKLFFHQ